MTEYLVFTLSASIGAMGDLAGHERRGSLSWPGRSAIIGLLGAALGIRRDGDFAALDQLGIAVGEFNETHAGYQGMFRDYHTVMTVPNARAKKPNSRPEALRQAGRGTNTTITHRDYRTGPLFGVVVWGDNLAALQNALREPVFALYLGRKSCPLSAPVAPNLVEADTVEAALAQITLPPWRGAAIGTRLMTDASPSDAYIETRHDCVVDRKRWHFSPRDVAIRDIHIRPED